MEKKVRPIKSSLVSGNRLGEKFFYHSPACTVEFVSEYIFLISKNKQAKKKQEYKKAKETKEENRISQEN